MGISPFTNGNQAGLVDEMIGTAYKTVRQVAENIEYVKHVSANMAEVYRLVGSIDAVDTLVAAIDKIDLANANAADISTVADNIAALLAINADLIPLNDVQAHLPELLEIQANLQTFLDELATLSAIDARVTAIEEATYTLIDEDDMASNSATAAPSQQSVKAYADTKISASVAGVAGLLLLATATQADAWSMISSASEFAQVATGGFSTDQAISPRIHRMTDRLFLDGAVSFNGEFLGVDITGLSADALALHNWGPRDASMFVDSSVAGMAIVGHSESKKFAGWSGTAVPAIPSSIGVSGFAINNRVGGNGQAWGGYFDAVRLTNGFTVGVEITMANFGSESTMTPFNVKTGGADGGVSVWAAIGCGLDLVAYPGAIKDIAAGFALLSSYADNSAKARTGFVIANGALRDRSGGSLVYEAFSMPDRHQISWYRASDATQTAFIWADVITGSPVGLTFKTGQVEFTGGGTWVNGMTVGLATTGQTPYLTAYGADANIGLNYDTKGTGVHSFYTNATAKQFEIRHAASAVNYLSMVGGAAGGGVSMSAQGSDANVALTIQSKGSGSMFLNVRSLIALQLDGVASSVNRMAIINAATAGQPMMYVAGSDTNVSGALRGLGTGGWQFLDGGSVKKFEYNTTGVGFFNVAPAAQGAIALPTGTIQRTTYATGTVTLPQLAGVVMAMITDLRSYGLAG